MFSTLSAVLLFATSTASAGDFALTSTALSSGKFSNTQVFKGFGCEGDNQSPDLSWSDAPAGTKSFALMVHDPDAPTGGAGWWHWVVYNIPASTTSLPAGVTSDSGLPTGAVQGTTDFGTAGWGGPCPPEGDEAHRYNFTVYALKVDKLELPAGATASLTGFMVNMNAIGSASLQARYGR